MMNKFVTDWLEAGFTEISGVANEIRRKNSLIPALINDKGENQTPKPLFPCFSSEEELEPEFLPKYLFVLENKFRHADSIKLDECIKDTDGENFERKEPVFKRTPIEYSRKNIFLSRVKFNFFEMPDSSVLKGSPEYSKVLERNQLYQNALERHRKFPDMYKEDSTQTHFLDTIEKEIQTDEVIKCSKACMVNNYTFNKHYLRKETDIKPLPKTFTEFFEAKAKFRDYKEFLETISSHPSILCRVQDTLYAMEKILDYNTFSESILKFNGTLADLSDLLAENSSENEIKLAKTAVSETSNDVAVKHHLTFYLEKVKNYAATCIDCNSTNPNIFVAGYGVPVHDEMRHENRGMVVCWNINKCGYPEKIYQTEEIVTCLEFSRTEQYLVAVGMRYGLVALFHLQKQNPGATSHNQYSKVKPNGAIKNVRWFKEKFGMAEETDSLLTVSADGIVCCWSTGKYLEATMLRPVKRGDPKRELETERMLSIAVDASGTCMEFQPRTQDTFLVGTMEGEALLANTTDPEGYREVFKCHDGPLLDLQWSPFLTDVFVTTGIDRLVHVWEVGKRTPRKSLSLEEHAFKVVWSRTKSTLFAVLSKAKVLVFDLSVNLHKEIAQYVAKDGVSFTCISFCPKNNWMVVGRSDGAIELLELCDVPDLVGDQESALKNTFLFDN